LDDTLDTLTPKQREVYDLLAQGLDMNRIAERWKVTPQAIHLHVRNIREKGIQLPSGQAEPPPVSTAPAATTDGAAGEDLDARLRAAIEDRLTEIDADLDQLHKQADKYRVALAALA
jgi:hypothetical protein